MLQRFRNLVDDVIEVTKVSTVSSTFGEVTRTLTKNESASQQGPAEVLTPWAPTEQDKHQQAISNCCLYNQDDDKIKLMELLDLRNFSLKQMGTPPGQQDKQPVKIRHIRSRKYQDSDSSDDDKKRDKLQQHLQQPQQQQQSQSMKTTPTSEGNTPPSFVPAMQEPGYRTYKPQQQQQHTPQQQQQQHTPQQQQQQNRQQQNRQQQPFNPSTHQHFSSLHAQHQDFDHKSNPEDRLHQPPQKHSPTNTDIPTSPPNPHNNQQQQQQQQQHCQQQNSTSPPYVMTTPEVLINDSQTDQTNFSSKARQMSPTGFSNHPPGEYSTAQKTDPCKMHRPHRSPYPHSHVPSHPGVERGHVRRPSAHKISPHENNPGQLSRHSGSAVPPSESVGFAGSQAHQPPPGMARGLREHHSRDMQQYPGFVPIARRSRARHVTGSAMNLSSSRSRESVMTGGGVRRPSSDSYGSREFSNDEEANNYRQSYKSSSSRQYEASPRSAHHHKPGQNMSRRRSQDFSEDYVRHTSAGGGGRRMNEDRIRRRPSHSRPHSGPDPSSYLPGSASTMPPMSAGQGYGPKKLSPTHHYAGNYPPQSSRGHRSRGRGGRMGRGMPQATSTPPTTSSNNNNNNNNASNIHPSSINSRADDNDINVRINGNHKAANENISSVRCGRRSHNDSIRRGDDDDDDCEDVSANKLNGPKYDRNEITNANKQRDDARISRDAKYRPHEGSGRSSDRHPANPATVSRSGGCGRGGASGPNAAEAATDDVDDEVDDATAGNADEEEDDNRGATEDNKNDASKSQISSSPVDRMSKDVQPAGTAASTAANEATDDADDIEKLFESYNNEKQRQNNEKMQKKQSKQQQQQQINLVTTKPCSNSKDSLGSCYSSAGEEHVGKITISGDIQFGLNFDYKSNCFSVVIKQCRGLATADVKKQRSDPYVKSYLLPDKTKTGKRKTKVKTNTVNPVFEEALKYTITKSELETRTLQLTVWSRERFGRNDFLGEINMPLDYKCLLNNGAPAWWKLQSRAYNSLSSLTYRGDLDLSLKFVSPEHISGRKRNTEDKGELQIIVKEARNLTAIRSNGYSDPFCKCYLLPDRSVESKRKTTVIRRSCNPHWNQTIVYENVSWEELQERSIELTVWDHDRLTSNDFLGGVRLNLNKGKCQGQTVTWMDSNEEECLVWQAMLDRPNCWIEGTLMLRNNMNERKQ